MLTHSQFGSHTGLTAARTRSFGQRSTQFLAVFEYCNSTLLLDLLKASGCIEIFFGIESVGTESLKDANKQRNKVEEYRECINALHQRGVCVMAGFISGFDGDTPESITTMAKQLYSIGVDVPFLSILTPYRGTSAYNKMLKEERLRREKGWEFFNGYNVAFVPAQMTELELLAAHRQLWISAFSVWYTLKRLFRAAYKLRLGAFLMCCFMNLFYCLKATTRNMPKSFEEDLGYQRIGELTQARMHTSDTDKSISSAQTANPTISRFSSPV